MKFSSYKIAYASFKDNPREPMVLQGVHPSGINVPKAWSNVGKIKEILVL